MADIEQQLILGCHSTNAFKLDERLSLLFGLLLKSRRVFSNLSLIKSKKVVKIPSSVATKLMIRFVNTLGHAHCFSFDAVNASLMSGTISKTIHLVPMTQIV